MHIERKHMINCYSPSKLVKYGRFENAISLTQDVFKILYSNWESGTPHSTLFYWLALDVYFGLSCGRNHGFQELFNGLYLEVHQ